MTGQKFAPQSVTANDLVDGSVVFLRADGGWSRWLKDAAVADSKSASELLLQDALVAVDDNDVVDPYLIDLVEEDGVRRASHFREHLRTLGPSVLGRFATPVAIVRSDKDVATNVAA